MSLDLKALRALRSLGGRTYPPVTLDELIEAWNALPALLDLADRETLQFVTVSPAHTPMRRALAVDGALYELRQASASAWRWLCTRDEEAGEFATEAEAIEAARKHDRARRGAK